MEAMEFLILDNPKKEIIIYDVFNIYRKDGDQTEAGSAPKVTSCVAPPASLAPPTMYNVLSGASW